ncbi:hypothetical protein [Streptomyces sp. NBC_00932]|uniref:hypothetical protein n=1 Tax=Streptomyces sp. NBC_00932 TaxID=2903690 RepID=UPI003865066C|nr:hypothetical protein OG221_03455 [Streptomyces sp. NBC_00932]
MPNTLPAPSPAVATPTVKSAPQPYLLTPGQGEAARALLTFVGSLPLDGSSDAQLLAAVIAIRAARDGSGNLTGVDLRSLRLGDAEGALLALSGLGWQPQGDLLAGDPSTPVSVTVPELSGEPRPDRSLLFGKLQRSRVSGWTTRTLAAKPVKKASSPARLAALFLAAHSRSDRTGTLPAGLPGQCHAALPELLAKNFLSEVEGDRYRLSEAVRHLSGRYRERDDQLPSRPVDKSPVEQMGWEEWKAKASAALRRHVENVEHCPLCKFSTARVAEAFMRKAVPVQCAEDVRTAYAEWEKTQQDRGPRAAAFAAAFREDHGHGPSFKQLCKGLGWKKQPRALRALIVGRLIADEWLTNTEPVPWTLRPGKAGQ